LIIVVRNSSGRYYAAEDAASAASLPQKLPLAMRRIFRILRYRKHRSRVFLYGEMQLT
jgi:hypothetical protein